MKAKVTYPTDVREREDGLFKSVESDMMELEMSETSFDQYRMKFKKVGNGMNVWIEDNYNNDEVVSRSKNFDCLVRKLILAKKIINAVKSNALINCALFDDKQTEDDKKVANALECALATVNNFIDGTSMDLSSEDLELICKAAAYKKSKQES
jgi:hypothetical protein